MRSRITHATRKPPRASWTFATGPSARPSPRPNVREMLLQHILTKDIFQRVFSEDQFHRENNIARQLDGLEGTFFTGDVRRQAIDRLHN